MRTSMVLTALGIVFLFIITTCGCAGESKKDQLGDRIAEPGRMVPAGYDRDMLVHIRSTRDKADGGTIGGGGFEARIASGITQDKYVMNCIDQIATVADDWSSKHHLIIERHDKGQHRMSYFFRAPAPAALFEIFYDYSADEGVADIVVDSYLLHGAPKQTIDPVIRFDVNALSKDLLKAAACKP